MFSFNSAKGFLSLCPCSHSLHHAVVCWRTATQKLAMPVMVCYVESHFLGFHPYLNSLTLLSAAAGTASQSGAADSSQLWLTMPLLRHFYQEEPVSSSLKANSVWSAGLRRTAFRPRLQLGESHRSGKREKDCWVGPREKRWKYAHYLEYDKLGSGGGGGVLCRIGTVPFNPKPKYKHHVCFMRSCPSLYSLSSISLDPDAEPQPEESLSPLFHWLQYSRVQSLPRMTDIFHKRNYTID